MRVGWNIYAYDQDMYDNFTKIVRKNHWHSDGKLVIHSILYINRFQMAEFLGQNLLRCRKIENKDKQTHG